MEAMFHHGTLSIQQLKTFLAAGKSEAPQHMFQKL